jgi:hypothetical protein
LTFSKARSGVFDDGCSNTPALDVLALVCAVDLVWVVGRDASESSVALTSGALALPAALLSEAGPELAFSAAHATMNVSSNAPSTPKKSRRPERVDFEALGSASGCGSLRAGGAGAWALVD